ncbi:ornithine cyclodeaminase [Vulcanisaeta sp. EB80]|uniref:ornithine cyclodeaminase family protein n=1 Tax=Vulcanisaeta sp. EB80 TaxID=1650660 RepID=UPI0009BE298A|nr:ornithine cyclodeaminase family protein [Vulcanisaeta sp. EB80]PLC67964.1 ornithine cyclodeaminase [Vulcanisaeta sp. EB80]
MKVTVIGEREVNELLDFPESAKKLVDAIASAFRDYSVGRVVMPRRTVMYIDNDWWGVMPCGSRNVGFSVKIVNVIESNKLRGLPTTQGIVILLDDTTGVPLAVINGTALTAWRTAAASAVSIKYVAASVDNVALIGAGLQARYHVLLLTRVFNIKRLLIYSRTKGKAIELMNLARDRGVDSVIVDSGFDAVKQADVVIALTTSKEPVIYGSWLHEGMHVISVGAPERGSREFDDDVIRKASAIVVDSREAVINETGDIIIPMKNGLLAENNLIEIGEIIAGLRQGRASSRDITVFKTVGIAVEDLAAASYVYRLARDRGMGVTIEL